jgi:RNA polymerase sigma-70 factor (ECF subfamily)
MSNEEDLFLIQKISVGDSKAFESLLSKYKTSVFGLCRRLLGEKSMAEDLTQETWIKVVESSAQYRPTGSVQSWILTISRNLCLNHMRKSSWEELTNEEGSLDPEDPRESLEQLLISEQNQQALKLAFDNLPPQQRAALVLRLSADLSYAQIATEMQVSVDSVKVLIHRGKLHLQKTLGVRIHE